MTHVPPVKWRRPVIVITVLHANNGIQATFVSLSGLDAIIRLRLLWVSVGSGVKENFEVRLSLILG